MRGPRRHWWRVSRASWPASLGRVFFTPQPDNAGLSWLWGRAVKDSANRARAAAENAGARLGAVRVIDPSGRACETDVLAGWPSYGGGAGGATTVGVDEIVVTGARAAYAPAPPAAPPPPPPPGSAPSEAQIEAAMLALQPPLRELTSQACVVYGLN